MSSINTSPHLSPTSLQRLGLIQARLSQPVRLPRRRRVSSVEHVKGTRPRTTDELSFTSARQGSRPAIEIGGMWMRPCAVDEGDVFVLESSAGEVLHVEASGRGETPWAKDPANPSRVYIEPLEDAAFTVARRNGTGVVIVHEKGKDIYAYHFKRPKQAPQPIDHREDQTDATPPKCMAAEWLSQDDELWLQQLVETRVARGGVFNSAVAVGLASRLRLVSAQEQAQELSLLLAGRPTPAAHRPHAWYEQLGEHDRERLRSACLSHINALHDAFGDLRRELDIDAQRWKERLLPALHVRDDLEGPRSLMEAHGDGELVLRALARLDRETRRFMCSLPRAITLRDQRLTRVAEIDPGAWWVAGIRL